MKYVGRAVLVALFLVTVAGCGRQSVAVAPNKAKKVLGPAVARMFYPRHDTDLAKQIDQMLAEAKSHGFERLRALVCPHAGYEYSGKIAASGYKQLEGRITCPTMWHACSTRRPFRPSVP